MKQQNRPHVSDQKFLFLLQSTLQIADTIGDCDQ